MWDMISGIIIGMILGIFFMTLFVSDKMYKKGQVDALTGKVKYELMVNDDSTRTWKLIEEE